MSRASYGSPRVWSELRLSDGVRCSRKRVERLMRQAGLQGLHRRKFRGCTRRSPDATLSEDLVNRQFTVEGPGWRRAYVFALRDLWRSTN